ncbi:MAG: hypothetical protein JSU66_11655 [Deltaproteobacteria bacterium]|nr:MAG: hypothetical protein JSU66_11655 [Deltaproteobacteria bacterium]
MNETYEYLSFCAKPRCLPRVAARILEVGPSAVAHAGGIFYGLWVGQIGLGSNEGILMTAAEPSARRALDGVEDVVDSRLESLIASVRPERPVPPREPGVYAHRWFELRDSDWPEFVELSTRAWPEFERSFDSQILGLWRSGDVEPPRARALLLTRYPSLAMWERSRGERARSERESAIWQRFVRRHRLTDSTVVVTTRLLTA